MNSAVNQPQIVVSRLAESIGLELSELYAKTLEGNLGSSNQDRFAVLGRLLSATATPPSFALDRSFTTSSMRILFDDQDTASLPV